MASTVTGRQIVLSPKDRETPTSSLRDSKAKYKYMLGCYGVIMMSSGYKLPNDITKSFSITYRAFLPGTPVVTQRHPSTSSQSLVHTVESSSRTPVMIQTATSPVPVQNSLSRATRTLTPAAHVILSWVILRAEQIRECSTDSGGSG